MYTFQPQKYTHIEHLDEWCSFAFIISLRISHWNFYFIFLNEINTFNRPSNRNGTNKETNFRATINSHSTQINANLSAIDAKLMHFTWLDSIVVIEFEKKKQTNTRKNSCLEKFMLWKKAVDIKIDFLK